MPSTATGRADAEVPADGDSSLPEFVDWLAAVGIALGGLLCAVIGSYLRFVIDRPLVAEEIERGAGTATVMSRELTKPETLDLAMNSIVWTGTGFLLTGLAMLVFATGYVIVRHRAHRRAGAGQSANSMGSLAVVGAVFTAVVSFLPFAPAIGGALAGYVEEAESGRSGSVGALTGLLYTLPLLVVLAFVIGGFGAGFAAIGESGLALLTGGVFLFVFVIVAAISIAMGALGGYVAGRIRGR